MEGRIIRELWVRGREGGGPIEVVAPTPRTIVRPVGREALWATWGAMWAKSQSSTHVRWAALLALVKVESRANALMTDQQLKQNLMLICKTWNRPSCWTEDGKCIEPLNGLVAYQRALQCWLPYSATIWGEYSVLNMLHGFDAEMEIWMEKFVCFIQNDKCCLINIPYFHLSPVREGVKKDICN